MNQYIIASIFYIVMILGTISLLKYIFQFLHFVFCKLFHRQQPQKTKRKFKPWRVYVNQSIKKDKTKEYIETCWNEIK